jgi:hypothetical protein
MPAIYRLPLPEEMQQERDVSMLLGEASSKQKGQKLKKLNI